jgi:hypothetical protein
VKYLLLSFLLLMAPAMAQAESPCAYRQNAGDCMFNEGGWKQIALQHYDEDSDYVTIWEKQGNYLICTEKADHSGRRCATYGGDVEAFRIDAERETAARAARAKEEESRQAALAAEKREKMKDHGVELKKNGWNEIVRCDDGHDWSYVLEKDGRRNFCWGINAFAGPTEYPCNPFTGDLDKFKTVAAGAQQRVDEYSTAKSQGRLDEYLREQIKKKTPPVNCQDGFGQTDPQKGNP